MSLFLDWCVNQGYTTENPVKRISKPKLPKSVPKHLSKEDALKLLEYAQNFPYVYKFERSRGVAVLAVFIFTGVRLQGLRNIKMIDLNLENRSLFVL